MKYISDSQLITYASGPSKTPIDYVMVRNKERRELEMLRLFRGRGRAAAPTTFM